MEQEAKVNRWALGARLFGVDAAVSIWIAAVCLAVSTLYVCLHYGARLKEAEYARSLSSTESVLRHSLAVTQRIFLAIEATIAVADSSVKIGAASGHGVPSEALADLVSANLVIRDLVLISRTGQILAAGTRETLRHGLAGPLPMSGSARSRLWVSPQVQHYATGEYALYLFSSAKSAGLPAGSVWVAVVPTDTLSASLGYNTFDTHTVSLESAKGDILLSSLDELFNGRVLPVIADGELDGVARLKPGRFTAAPLLIAASTLVEDSIRVVVSLPASEATPGWSATFVGMRLALSAFTLLVFGGACALHYFGRRRLRKRSLALRTVQNVFDAIQSLPYGLVLIDRTGRIESWTREVEALLPHGNSKLLRYAPANDWAAQCVSSDHVVPPMQHGSAVGAGNGDLRHALLNPTIQFADGRVVRIVEHALPSGGTAVFMRDVTNITRDLKQLSLRQQRTMDDNHQLMVKMMRSLITPVTTIAGVVDLLSAADGCEVKARDLELLRDQAAASMLALRSLNVFVLHSDAKRGADQYRELIESVRL